MTALVVLGVALLAFAARASATTQATVQPGDTISGLAARYGVSTASIVTLNGIGDADVIAAGRTVAIPSGGGGGTGASGGGGSGVYTVRPGETLSGIAARHETTVQALVRANGLGSAHMIIAGTRLHVSGAGGRPGGYTVRRGETLSGIAARHGTTVQALVQANGLGSAHMIIAGTRLRIGGGGSSPSSSGGSGGYTVLPGENLGAIAARHGTSAQALAAANGIADPNLVIAGTRIQVPAGSASPAVPGGLTPVTAASSGWGNQPSKSDVAALMTQYAARHGVDPSLVRAVGWQESGWWQGARSATGAIGVMQLMPGTAAWAGPSLLGRTIDPYDVSDNIEAGAAYLGYLQRKTGSQRLAIASYYQGLESVAARGFYDDTTSYVDSVSSAIGRV